MSRYERKISKEIYDRAMLNKGYIAKEDRDAVFTSSELLGYGVYSDLVFERDGEHYVGFMLGDCCD